MTKGLAMNQEATMIGHAWHPEALTDSSAPGESVELPAQASVARPGGRRRVMTVTVVTVALCAGLVGGSLWLTDRGSAKTARLSSQPVQAVPAAHPVRAAVADPAGMSISFSPADPKAGQPVTITAKGRAAGGQYLSVSNTEFGDGTNYNVAFSCVPGAPPVVGPTPEPYAANVPPHVFDVAGTYSVTVTVGNGCVPGAAEETGTAILVVH